VTKKEREVMASKAGSAAGRGRSPNNRAVAALAAAVVVLALGLGACSNPALPVGLANCADELPLAEGALNLPKTGYTFRGVKRVTPKVMEKLVKRRYPTSPPAHLQLSATTKVCAFAFTGDFAAGQVAGAPAGVAGKAAVVLTTTDRRLLFSFVLPKLPEKFSTTFTA
jgi:hypothetical protein